jgi:DUF4097 and DUF4098 domain-containing protein YvlB
MRTMTIGLAVCTVAVMLSGSAAAQRREVNVHANVRDNGGPLSCDQIDVQFEGARTITAEDQRRLPKASVSTLAVEASRNGGVYVRGADADEYGISLCKAAADWAPGGTLNDIVLSTTNGRVAVNGPSGEGWVAYLLVTMPRNGSIDLRATNGPIGLRDVTGAIVAHAQNGPISLKNCAGRINVEATNGPISIDGGSGSVQIVTQNGPIGVKLAGTTWSGEGLAARAETGPVRLDIADNYHSGVEIDLSGHSPFSCRGAVCDASQKDWDNRSRTMRFGGGATRVRLTTVNGPVSIKSRP